MSPVRELNHRLREENNKIFLHFHRTIKKNENFEE
jgi:hypothetical protein